MSAGRPPIYTVELAAEVCRRMSEGESLLQVCRDPAMPSKPTVLGWARDMPAFAAQYAQARELLLEHWAQQILDIADTPQLGVKTKKDGDDTETVEGDMIEHRRLQVDARKWLLSKLAPKKYGERLDLGNSDGTPLRILIVDPTRRGSAATP